MTVLFMEGWNTFNTVYDTGEVRQPQRLSIVDSGVFPGKALKVFTRWAAEHDRGIYVPADVPAIWAGAHFHFESSAMMHRLFVIYQDGKPRFRIHVGGGGSGFDLSFGLFVDDAALDLTAVGLAGAVASDNTTFRWNPSIFVQVGIIRGDTSGRLLVRHSGVVVIDYETSDLAADGDPIDGILFSARSSNNGASDSLYTVDLTHMWVADEDLGSPLVLPALPSAAGQHQDGNVVGADSPLEAVTGANDGTMVQLQDGDKLTFETALGGLPLTPVEVVATRVEARAFGPSQFNLLLDETSQAVEVEDFEYTTVHHHFQSEGSEIGVEA